MIVSYDFILDKLCVTDMSLILFCTSWGIYLILKESEYVVVLLSIINKIQCVSLLILSSRFMTYSLLFLLNYHLEKHH